MSNANPIPENKVGSKEFYETMDAFEKTVAKGMNVARENKDVNKFGACYQNGETNALFKGFLHGVAFARCLANS